MAKTEKVETVLNAKGRRQDERGREIPDPVPMQPPVGYKPNKPIRDQIREMVRAELLRDDEPDTEEEASDFDVDDELPMRKSKYEMDEDLDTLPLKEVNKRRDYYKSRVAQYEAAARKQSKGGRSSNVEPDQDDAPAGRRRRRQEVADDDDSAGT